MIVNKTEASLFTTSLRSASPTLKRYSLVIGLSLSIALAAGVVLSQVLQPAKPVLLPITIASASLASGLSTATPVPPAPIKLDTIVVQMGDIEQTVAASGKLQLYKYADVNAQLSGQIKDVMAAVGDTVKAGKMVIDITPTLQPAKVESNRAQMARLQAELADQRAQMDFAELQFKRQTQLKAQNATREESYESSRMTLSSASARVESINAQVHQLEANMKQDEESRQHTQVLAPISGTVVTLNARAGQLVNASQQTASLMRIADLSKMTVQARVAEMDVTRLRKGMKATFTTPGYPGKQWVGKLRQVIPVPAEGTGEQGKQTFYNVLFEVDNPDQQLMSGMSTQVLFVVDRVQDAVLLPAPLLTKLLGKQDVDGSYSVNVVTAQAQISPRKIQIGTRNHQQVQVLSGLVAGEKVLVGAVPLALLKPKSLGASGIPMTPSSQALQTLIAH